jgi:crotonobetainyl-CoA:carnitine CoA-transferase CaiB-like acyl-CoA transferase
MAAPLNGVRIVSIAQNVPGPVALARLVAAGARAVKVEPPGGDPLWTLCRSWYRALHRGIAVERIDLKTAPGRARLGRLLNKAHLLLASQRPAALARLGLDADTVASTHPRVRWLNIVGDTQDPERPGHDLTYQARAGLVGREMPRTLLADLFGAERAVGAALLLLAQDAPIRAQVGLADALDAACSPLRFALTAEDGPLGGGLPEYRVYEARQGRVAVAALEPHFRARLYAALNLPDGHALDRVMRTRTARQWERWAARLDLPMARVADPPK